MNDVSCSCHRTISELGRFLHGLIDTYDLPDPLVGWNGEMIEIQWSEVWLTFHPTLAPEFCWDAILTDSPEHGLHGVDENALEIWIADQVDPSKFGRLDPPQGGYMVTFSRFLMEADEWSQPEIEQLREPIRAGIHDGLEPLREFVANIAAIAEMTKKIAVQLEERVERRKTQVAELEKMMESEE